MIKKINHRSIEISKKIYRLFQASYSVEAELLNIDNFPPLRRTVDDLLISDTEFYAFWKNNEMAALVEIKNDNACTDIQSLVVHPKCFRQGLGIQLISFILNSLDSEIFTVETGLENKPAIRLYEKLGFQKIEQWETTSSVKIVKYSYQ